MRKRPTLNHLGLLLLVFTLSCCFNAAAKGWTRQAEKDGEQAAKPTPSVASLLQKLRDKDEGTRDAASSELARRGPAAVPALTDFLKNEKGPGRVYAAAALAR